MKKRLKELRKGKRWSRYFLMIFGMLLALFCLLLLVAKIMSYGAAELFQLCGFSAEDASGDDHGGVDHREYPWRCHFREADVG